MNCPKICTKLVKYTCRCFLLTRGCIVLCVHTHFGRENRILAAPGAMHCETRRFVWLQRRKERPCQRFCLSKNRMWGRENSHPDKRWRTGDTTFGSAVRASEPVLASQSSAGQTLAALLLKKIDITIETCTVECIHIGTYLDYTTWVNSAHEGKVNTPSHECPSYPASRETTT